MKSVIINSGKGSKHRPLYEIGKEIRQDWTKEYFGATPYLDVICRLNTINDQWMDDSGESIVRYFLSNAKTWRGEVARRVKKELNAMIS